MDTVTKNEDKRKRMRNFSFSEEENLLSLIAKYSNIIENKNSDANIWMKKRETWEKILKELEIQTGFKRTAENLKLKYENLKKKARRELADQEKDMYLNGGEESDKKLSIISQKIVAILESSAKEQNNACDDDRNREDCPLDDISDCLNEDSLSVETGSKDFSVEDMSVLEEDEEEEEEDDYKNIIIQKRNPTTKKRSWCNSWCPYALKLPKSSRLHEKNRGLEHFEKELFAKKIKLISTKDNYFENEEKRAKERHEWQKEISELEKKHKQLQIKSLEIDLRVKAMELRKKKLK